MTKEDQTLVLLTGTKQKEGISITCLNKTVNG